VHGWLVHLVRLATAPGRRKLVHDTIHVLPITLPTIRHTTCGGIFNKHFAANLLENLTVKKV